MIFGVENTAHCNEGIRLGVEYMLDYEAQLEGLTGPLDGRRKEAFSPARNTSPGKWSRLLPRNGRGKGRAQMQVAYMEVATAWKRKNEMLQRSIPCEGDAGQVCGTALWLWK